jgi:hypothetical protein
MALYAQHGHGKSDRIIAAAATGDVQGVIFGARNEKSANLVSCIGSLRAEYELDILLDPQFYVSTLNPPNEGYLTEYPYYTSGLAAADFVGSRRLRQYAQDTLAYQADLDVTRLVSPSVIFDSFEDRWFQIALSLADASLECVASLNVAAPLLLTFVLAEQCLSSRRELDVFLDQLTAWEMKGIYLLVAREESSYSQRFEPQRLANLMYLIHVLSHLNDFEVIVGYSDFCGLLLRAVGAAAFATGWNQSLRQFCRRSFIRQRPGGKLPRLRYSSAPLLNSILLSELDQTFDVGDLEIILSGIPLDSVITSAVRPGASDWNRRISDLHHWQTLHKLDEKIAKKPSEDLTQIEAAIEAASAIYEIVQADGVIFERNSQGQHLEDWTQAIQLFRQLVNL